MKNKDTNTDYQKVVRLGDQKWEIVKTAIRIIFFFFFDPHLKCQFPPKISIWPKSLLYKPFEKWLNPPITQGEGGGGQPMQKVSW